MTGTTLTLAADATGVGDALRWALTIAYIALLLTICIYGLHRYWLVYLYRKHQRHIPRPKRWFADLPRVTIQLPIFNEGAVAQRIIDAACAVDYPRDRLQVQVLDDSTDDSADIARRCAEEWKKQGIDIQYRHRTDRTGFKAGALADAMPDATGDFIAIFDADFIPNPAFLKRTIHYFTDDQVGMVQTRWTHLNREDSWLTRGQAIFLDGHFLIEHTARSRSGAFMNFSGTAGIWRRAAIEQAGGWQHDTLTEDLDLSYRAQLRGWNFVFLPWVRCPAELPPEINAFKSQQHRWTKGSVQTALKLLPRVLTSRLPLSVKVEAFFHLTCTMVYLYMTLMTLLFYPAIYVNIRFAGSESWVGVFLALTFFAMGTVSATVYYVASQKIQHRSVWKTIAQTPLLMAIGIGVALSNAVACLEALFRHESPFIRTPKYGDRPAARKPRIIPIPSMRLSITFLEIAMGFYMLECARLSLTITDTIVGLPFLLLFASGYFYVGFSSLYVHIRGYLDNRRPVEPQAA